jgi:hypothetical protein
VRPLLTPAERHSEGPAGEVAAGPTPGHAAGPAGVPDRTTGAVPDTGTDTRADPATGPATDPVTDPATDTATDPETEPETDTDSGPADRYTGEWYTMPGGGFSKLPSGSVVVALSLPSPGGDGSARFLVHAANRARALTRLRNLGLRAVYLRGNAEPPTPDEITAVLHHPDGLLWRRNGPLTGTEPWRPARALFRERAAIAER